MATNKSPVNDRLLEQARQFYVECVLRDLQPLQEALLQAAQELNDRPAERAVAQLRRDMLQELMKIGPQWPAQLREFIQDRLAGGSGSGGTTSSAPSPALALETGLQLVDDETVQRNILESRIALAILDKTTWEFADLRARLAAVAGRADLEDSDLFRPQVLGRCLLKSWLQTGLSLESWRQLEGPMHRAWGAHIEQAFRETNQWLVAQGVMPEVDLRSFIRRTDSHSPAGRGGASAPAEEPAAADDKAPTRSPAGSAGGRATDMGEAEAPARPRTTRARLGAFITRVLPSTLTGNGPPDSIAPEGPASDVMSTPAPRWVTRDGGRGADPGSQATRGYEETRLMTRAGPVDPASRAEAVLQRFSDMLERHLPGFKDTHPAGAEAAVGEGAAAPARAPSARLNEAMQQVQQRVAKQTRPAGEAAADPAQLVKDMREGQKALKQAAATPGERATIELVALLFQSILTEDRIPPTLRIWFARLQMPTLRVALAEPDFFSTAEHPARKLIDRMGGCVMGFEGGAEIVGTPLESEIKRVVQVVEAFPDTGRRVFQAVLVEFERFLERYYREHNERSRAGVSLAQQIEQRETLAIQYTIELRNLLKDVPVHERVRDFLFHIWADVLATTAVRHGAQSEAVKATSAAATELIWAASAKTNFAERQDTVRRLPPLLGVLRMGMSAAGLEANKQEEAIKAISVALQAAFSAATSTAIPQEQLEKLKKRLAAIEEIIPDDDMELDDAWVLDEASHQYEGLEIIADGGSMPDPDMLKWAAELEVGSAFMLDYRGRNESVRLAWHGMRRHLSLFVTSQGRSYLFQKTRLAAFLQAGLLVPAQEESLTTMATRSAYLKVGADPGRLAA